MPPTSTFSRYVACVNNLPLEIDHFVGIYWQEGRTSLPGNCARVQFLQTDSYQTLVAEA
jgi:hypothetical protein